jgi:nitrogen regulatory protein P-II 1
VYRGGEHTVEFLPKIEVAVVVPDELSDTVAMLFVSAARTGSNGHGKVVVSALDDTVRIRTGEHGEAAL